MAAKRSRGFNLPELMVSLAIGLFLLAAFLRVLERCRSDFAANESLARMSDAARHALSVLVPDLEHAGFYGITCDPRTQLVRDGIVVADAAGAACSQTRLTRCHRSEACPLARTTAAATSPSTFPGPCRARTMRSALASMRAIARPLPVPAALAPAPTHSPCATPRSPATAPRAGRLQLYARRIDSQGPVSLFADGRAPGPLDAHSEIRDLEVHTYYIAKNSVGRPGWPALRLKSLTESRGAMQFRDEEILPGVEDLQVEFGVVAAGESRTPVCAARFPGPA